MTAAFGVGASVRPVQRLATRMGDAMVRNDDAGPAEAGPFVTGQSMFENAPSACTMRPPTIVRFERRSLMSSTGTLK
jgi:hypothetical protein